MITDTMLKEALLEMNEVIISSYPEPEECYVDFSPRFERKMQKVIRKGNHPDFYRFRQRAASILLILLMGFMTLMAVSPTARATVIGWIREKYEIYFTYKSSQTSDQNTVSEDIDYQILYIPNGYQHKQTINKIGGIKEIYHDENGNELQISFIKNPNSTIFVENLELTAIPTKINNIEAHYYGSKTKDGTNYLIWNDHDKNILYIIASNESEKEIKKIAKNLE